MLELQGKDRRDYFRARVHGMLHGPRPLTGDEMPPLRRAVWVCGPFETRRVPGTHVTMFAEPHVRELVSRINPTLERERLPG